MKKITTHLLAGTAVMFMTACGGGGSSDTIDPMTLKDGVAIIYHYPAEVCTSDLLMDELQATIPEAENFLLRVESNDVTCATYGKTDGVDCESEDAAILIDPSFSEYDTSCVLGFDLVISTASSTQLMEDIALAAEFTLDAQ